MKNQKGFTLIELMIVVAIIGILAAVAIPQYQQYTNKAKQSEAKLMLSAIYTSEQTFNTENGQYTGCLTGAGFTPEGYSGTTHPGYYTVGFNAAGATPPTLPTTCKTPAGADCTANPYVNGCSFFQGGKGAGTSPNFAPQSLSNATVSTNQFTAKASANLKSTTTDEWTINNAKTLTNSQSGI
jgi:type IV pilus assembly protein PilA